MSSSRARYRTTTPGSSTRRAGSRQSPISASSRSRADSCSREQITFLVTARCATRPYRITVLTTDEVRAIPLFSALESKDLEHLARTSEDIHLRGGEWAVHEGGERALFAVLAGKIEVIKLIDGIERRLGWRVPGTIFGEVPLALGTPFPGGYRASEPSRVMRVDVQQYYAIAAVSKDISQKVSALARERIGGLQSITAEPQKPRVTLIGHRWDTACGNLRRFLARNQISFNWLTPDAPEL